MEENNQVPWRYIKYDMTLLNDHFPSSKPAIFIFTKKNLARMDGWTNGRTDEQMDGQLDKWTVRWTDSQMDG